MFLTPHAAVGILIGTQTTNPVAAFVFSFLSHFVLDLVPHGDDNNKSWVLSKHTKRRAIGMFAADAGAMTLFIAALSERVNFPHPMVTAAAILGGVMPDILAGWYAFVQEFFPKKLKNRLFSRTGLFSRVTRRMFFEAKFLDRLFRIHHVNHRVLGVTISPSAGLALQAGFLFFIFAVTVRVMS